MGSLTIACSCVGEHVVAMAWGKVGGGERQRERGRDREREKGGEREEGRRARGTETNGA